jgi:predicted DNA-binding protein (UPF0251 family)
MNAAVQVMQDSDIIEQALAGVERRGFERAEQELKDADAAIRSAEAGLHRLTRLRDEAKVAHASYLRSAAQAALEGAETAPYSGPDPTDAQRLLAVAQDELNAMKLASQQAVARRAAAREALQADVQRRLTAAYATLADSLVEVYLALELTGSQPLGQPYCASFSRLAIPAAPGMAGDDTRLYASAVSAVRDRERIRAQLRALVPEATK